MKDDTTNRDPTIVNYSAPPPCLVCGTSLFLRLAQNHKSGRAFIMLRCPRDGRHFRAFINDPAFVEYVIERMEENTRASSS